MSGFENAVHLFHSGGFVMYPPSYSLAHHARDCGGAVLLLPHQPQGFTGMIQTFSVLNAGGGAAAITSVSIASSSGHGILDDAAVAAAYTVGSYPNPTGATVSVTTNVSFSIR